MKSKPMNGGMKKLPHGKKTDHLKVCEDKRRSNGGDNMSSLINHLPIQKLHRNRTAFTEVQLLALEHGWFSKFIEPIN